MSCIDHVNTNQKFRCSSVTVSPFGNSDHELISYIRVSKEPPCPSRVIRRRTYKNFVKDDFLRDLSKINWSPVYSCQDVDIAVQIFTSIFKEVLYAKSAHSFHANTCNLRYVFFNCLNAKPKIWSETQF